MSIHEHTPEQVAKEVKDHFHYARIKQTDVAEYLAITKSTLSGHLSGKKYISPEIAAKLAEKYHFNIDFLVAGKGKLFGNKELETIQAIEEELLKTLKKTFNPRDGKTIDIGELIECTGREVPTYMRSTADGKTEEEPAYTLVIHKKRDKGERIGLLYYDELDGEEEIPFSSLSLTEAISLNTAVEIGIIEDREMGKMGEIAYRFKDRTKRKDDVSLIGIKRTKDNLMLIDIADEILEDKGIVEFISRLASQELEMGVYPEYKAKYAILFGWLSILFSNNLVEKPDFERMEKDFTEMVFKMYEERSKKIEKWFSGIEAKAI